MCLLFHIPSPWHDLTYHQVRCLNIIKGSYHTFDTLDHALKLCICSAEPVSLAKMPAGFSRAVPWRTLVHGTATRHVWRFRPGFVHKDAPRFNSGQHLPQLVSCDCAALSHIKIYRIEPVKFYQESRLRRAGSRPATCVFSASSSFRFSADMAVLSVGFRRINFATSKCPSQIARRPTDSYSINQVESSTLFESVLSRHAVCYTPLAVM